MSGHREKRSKRQHDPSDVHMADDDEGGSSHLNVVSGRQLRKVMGVPLVMMKLKMRLIGWSTGQGKA